jgi:endo-1,4-beta-xylanase
VRTLVALAAVCTLATACGDERPGRAPFPGGAGARVAAAHTDVPLGTAVTWSVLQDDDEQAAAVGRAFDSITPENEMKWEVVEPRRGRFAFGDADALVGWARAHGKRVRGHTLVWHQQAPAWLGAEDWSAAEAERILVEHVRAVAGHFRGKVDSWDVVNEPFTDDGGWRSDENFPFLDKLGPRYVEVALRAARQADPGARLVINEIGAESGGPKLAALVKLARDLRGRGVPLDAIGLESHHEVGKAPSRARVRATMRALAATGVDVEVTELDVADPSGDARAQAAAYADTAAACAAVRACRRLTIWGVSDRDSWLGADRRALPFDTELRPKPAWDALVTALKR